MSSGRVPPHPLARPRLQAVPHVTAPDPTTTSQTSFYTDPDLDHHVPLTDVPVPVVTDPTLDPLSVRRYAVPVTPPHSVVPPETKGAKRPRGRRKSGQPLVEQVEETSVHPLQ